MTRDFRGHKKTPDFLGDFEGAKVILYRCRILIWSNKFQTVGDFFVSLLFIKICGCIHDGQD